ncbi:MAG: hypothetical protein WCG26_11060, partial [Chloroflexales bacterium]
MIFRNPHLLWLLLLLPTTALLWRWRGMRVPTAALALRLATLASVIFALADPLVGAAPPPVGPTVVLVDQSASLTAKLRAALRDRAANLANASDEVRVLYFGADVVSGRKCRRRRRGQRRLCWRMRMPGCAQLNGVV